MVTLLEISNRTLRVPTTPFKNEPLTDFGNPENARKMKAALTKVRAELGREYDMVIGNRLVKSVLGMAEIRAIVDPMLAGRGAAAAKAG